MPPSFRANAFAESRFPFSERFAIGDRAPVLVMFAARRGENMQAIRHHEEVIAAAPRLRGLHPRATSLRWAAAAAQAISPKRSAC